MVIDPMEFACHSFCIGAVTTAEAAGVEDGVIKSMAGGGAPHVLCEVA